LFRGESDVVESVNWLPIFLHVKGGGSSPRLDWVGPFLQIFVGHCVFVSRDLAANYLDQNQLKEFGAFRAQARTGKDLSLRSLITWARGSEGEPIREALDAMWRDTVVGCQLGTDYHIAIRRVTAILGELAGRGEDAATVDPTIAGITDLNRGFQEFRNGTISAFCGNLIHSAELLSDAQEGALLLAGPADVRVPSLNTIAGTKGMFDATGREPRANDMGGNVLAFWSKAVQWFRDEVINCNSDAMLREILGLMFEDFLNVQAKDATAPEAVGLDRVQILKGLMQTWVRWFTDPAEARSFIGDSAVEGMTAGSLSTRDLVQHYEELCDWLNPAVAMKAPRLNDPRERALWRFPVFAERSRASSVSQPGPEANNFRAGARTKAGKIEGGGARLPKR